MKPGFVTIVECFNISRVGLMTELQHFENGIPPETQIIDVNTKESWIVLKPENKKQKVKPEIGTELKIKTTPQQGV